MPCLKSYVQNVFILLAIFLAIMNLRKVDKKHIFSGNKSVIITIHGKSQVAKRVLFHPQEIRVLF